VARFSAIKAVGVTLASLSIAALAYMAVFGRQAWPLLRRAIIGTFEGHNAWMVCLVYGPLALTLAACLFGNVLLNWAYLIPTFFALPIVLLLLSKAECAGWPFTSPCWVRPR
jgi:nitrate reductase NapE component